MIPKIRLLLFLLAGSFLLTACFHKSDTTGTADDIKHSFICHTPNGDYLVTHDEVFHATSKSSGPKGTFISGYTDYRYTVRDLQTGVQITRLVTGDRDEDFVPICYDDKQLWCYSVQKKLGLHTRDPKSMEVLITREQVEKVNPSLAGNMNTPKIYSVPQFYSYDPVSNGIILADLQGNFHRLDMNTLEATLLNKRPSFSGYSSNTHSSSAKTSDGKSFSLSGDLRKFIEWGDKNTTEQSYLSGEILLEQNTSRLSTIAKEQVEANSNNLEKEKHEFDSLLKLYPVLTDRRQAFISIKDYRLIEHFSDLQSKLSYKSRDSANKIADISRGLTGIALGGDSNVVYVLHADNLTDTSSLLISKLNIKGSHATSAWTTLVPQIYFDPSKGIKRNSMADMFKSGNPQFRYEWYGVEGNVLVGIKMLFAFGIDINTGKLLWKVQL